MTQTGISIRPWQNRLLVLQEQTPIAWLDPETGDVLRTSGVATTADLQAAYDSWRNGWQDLAANVAGQQARQRADQQWEAMGRVRAWTGWLLDAKTDERAWRIGAQGERMVGGRLDRLRRHGFEVLHSLPVGTRGADIDHLVVGPPGVFSVNTKHHPGASVWVRHDTVKVNGHNVAYVRNARYEAQRVAGRLQSRLGWSPPVRGVIVVIADRLTVKQGPEGTVSVIERFQAPRWFRRQRQTLDPAQVAQVFAVARQSTTWA